MAAPSFRSKGAYGTGTTSCTAAMPTGGSAPQANDIILILVESTDSTSLAGTPNTPSGYTKIFEESQGAGATGVTTLTIFGKRAGASEANVTIDGVLNHCSATALVFQGAVQTGTAWGVGTGNGGATSTGTALGLTTPEADCLVIMCIGTTRDAITSTEFSAWTNGNLTSLTEREDNCTNTAAGGGIGAADGTKAAAGATGDTTVTNTAVNWRAVHVYLRPQPSGVTVEPAIADFSATGTNPAVIQGAISFGPAAAENFSLTGTNPITVQGAISIAPALGEFSATAGSPAVILGPISITASFAHYAVNATNPTVFFGPTSVSPAVADFSLTATNPTFPPLIVQPAIASLKTLANSPSVVLGPIVFTASFARFTTSASNPITIQGAISFSPAIGSFKTTGSNPVVIQGAITFSPAIANFRTTADNPTIPGGGGVTVTPAVSDFSMTAGNPVVILGAVSITTQSAQFRTTGSNPVVVYGTIVFTPNFARYAVTATNPSIGEPVRPDPANLAIYAVNPIVWVTAIPANLALYAVARDGLMISELSKDFASITAEANGETAINSLPAGTVVISADEETNLEISAR